MSISNNEKNLYDFYRLIGAGSFAAFAEGQNYCAVSGKEGSWPQLIFDVRFKESAGSELNKAFLNTAENHNVRLAVCNRSLFTPTDQELLRQNEIFPVGNWQLMEINTETNINCEVQKEYEIRRLTMAAEINEYVSLLNSDLMNSQKVKGELFQELSLQPGIELYGLYYGSEIVSGLLTYGGANKVAGLYFIVTRQKYRGKGLAAGLIGEVIQALFKKGIGKVVLQALPKAVNLYARMGFSQQGELVIIWKK